MRKKRAAKGKDNGKFPLYNKKIYCIDIETSTDYGVNFKGEKVEVSFMISFAVSSLNFITGEIKHEYFGRNYTELNDYLFTLEEEAGGLKTLIYCHFFAYEWSFFKDNLSFFKERQTKQLFVKNNKPLIIQCKNLSFRCSLLLLNKSVETLGNELTKRLNEDWTKLDFDYGKKRTPLDPLTPEEIEYNYRDVDIVLKYIQTILIPHYSIKVLYDKYFTVTGKTRIDNKNNNTAADYRSWIIFNNFCRPKTYEQYLIEEKAFMGGLVSSNPSYCGHIVNNVFSMDIKSSYPYVMYCLKFPYGFYENNVYKNIEAFNDYRGNIFYNNKKFFYGQFVIENLRIKKDINYPIWSKHKAFNTLDVIDINGKIIKAKRIEVICTSLDYEHLIQFYDFDLVEIKEIYVNKYTRKLPKYVLNNIERLLKSKSDLKSINNIIEDAVELCNKYELPEGWEWLAKIINDADTLMEQKELMSSYYHDEKSALNAQYGINVQHPLQDEITYDYETRRYIATKPDYNKFLEKKSCKTNMCIGTFITAFARHQLIKMLHTLLINNITVYYTDTDSIKFDYSDPEKARALFTEFNNNLVKNDWSIGIFEEELNYRYFCSNGNKSYIVNFTDKEGKDIIKATISGMPKASEIYNKLYRENFNSDFRALVNNAFAFNIIINPSVTNKLTSKYTRSIIEIDEGIEVAKEGLIHIKIGKYDDYVYSGVILKEVPLTIRGIETSKDQFRNACNLIRYFNLNPERLLFNYTLEMKDNKITVNKQPVTDEVKEALFNVKEEINGN